MKILVVIDMQNDFIRGSLSHKDSEKIVPYVVNRIRKAQVEKETVYFTRDTHTKEYLSSREGQALPIEHCIWQTWGWNLIDEISPFADNVHVVDKVTFGSKELGKILLHEEEKEHITEITLLGVCTDICVISNALLLRAYLPEAEIFVEEAGCAGVTEESHETALRALRSCQIKVIR